MLFLSIGANSQVLINEDFSTASGTVPPAGWTSLDNNSSTEVWEFIDPAFYANTPITGIAAIFNSGGYGPGPVENASLVSPAFNASGVGYYILTFDHYFDEYDLDNYNVEVFDGTTWTSVLSGSTSTTLDPQSESINITAAVNGSSAAKLRFTYIGDWGYYWVIDNVKIEKVSCAGPSSVLFASVTHNSATANWTAGAETTWNIEYGPAGFALGSGTPQVVTTTPTYTMNSLITLTDYEFYIQSDCGSGDLSSWAGPFSFSTTCLAPVISTFPWTEDFDSTPLAELPCGWTLDNVNGDFSKWRVDDYVSNSGDNSLYMSYNYSQAMNDWAFTNEFVLQTGINYQFTFAYRSSGTTYPESLSFHLGQSASVAGMTTQLVDLPSILSSTYQNSVITFTVPANGSYYFGFHGYSTANQNYMSVDDLKLEVLSGCDAVTAITLDDVTDQTADISWTAGATETSWNIQYGSAGFTIGSGTTDVMNTTPTYSVSGLTANTQYDFYVQANCGPTQSSWVGPFTFSTNCGPTVISTFPWIENFDSEILPELPCGWTTSDLNGDGETWKTDDYDPNSGDNSLLIEWSSSQALNDWAYTPEFILEAGVNYQFSFSYLGSDVSFPEKMKLYQGQSATVAGMTTQLIDLPNIVNDTYITEAIQFTVPTNGSYYFGFHAYSDADMFIISVDDVKLEILPCTDDASFTFASDSLCADGNTVTPVITGTTGGTFSGTAGLDVNPTTGAVNPVNSSIGVHYLIYTVTSTNCLEADSVAITVYDCTTSGIDQLTIDGVSVYPNPSTGTITVNLPSKLDAMITLVDYTGKEVDFLTNQNSDMQYQLDLSTLVDGIYFVKISVDNKQIVEKIILKK